MGNIISYFRDANKEILYVSLKLVYRDGGYYLLLGQALAII